MKRAPDPYYLPARPTKHTDHTYSSVWLAIMASLTSKSAHQEPSQTGPVMERNKP
jgi:hypothetical protein